MNPPSADMSEISELQLNQWHLWAAKDRYLLYAAIAILAAFAIGLLSGQLFDRDNSPYEVTAKIGPPPPVEPFLLKKVDPETARQANAEMPLSKSPVPPASAFIFKGSPADFDRAADCLAATIFYEAGAEKISGQMAVVQVVLNRARHPAYPNTVCGVVFQGHERRTGCQFSYTCDGSMARRPSAEAWARHRGLAQAMLKGLVYAPVGLATHYHTDWVLPAWSAKLDKIRVEGTHLFFRFNGYWGTPAAYRRAVTGVETSFAKLGGLSPAHGKAAPAEELLAETGDAETFPEAPDLERVSATLDVEDPAKEVFLIYVDPLLDAASLTRMAENACDSRKTCKVFAWADQALMPQGLPLESNDRASMAFSYIRAGKGGRQKWNCELFPRESKGECL